LFVKRNVNSHVNNVMVENVYNVLKTLKKKEKNVFLMLIVILLVIIVLQVVIKMLMKLVLNAHKIVLIVMIQHAIHVLMGSIMIMEFVQHVKVIV